MLTLLPQYDFDNKDEFYVCVEKYNKQSNYVLFDFVDSNEFAFFNFISQLNYNWEQRPTMIELINYSGKKVQEGVTYQISKESLTLLLERIQIVEDSLIIGFRLELNINDSQIFGKSKSFTPQERFERSMDQTNNSELPKLDLNIKKIDKLIVRNIGQGSWNELLLKDKFHIVFDFGTIYTTKRTDLLKMIGNRNEEYQKSKPIFILSHWDVDHYHFLLGFNDSTISSIPLFIYRSDIPNLTARKALGRFRILNRAALIPIATVSPPSPRRSSNQLVNIDLTGNGDLLIQNAYKNHSRNKSGLGLTLRKKNVSVVLSADYDYSQISNNVLPILNYICNHYLVVPHHGGKAGTFNYANSPKNKLKGAIISVGKNPYKPPHPYKNNIDDLKAKGFSIIRTDFLKKDYCIDI